MQSKRVYFRPSARGVLEVAPAQVAVLLAQYLKLLEDFALKQGVRSTRTEVAGHQSRGQGGQQFTIIHQVGLPQGDMGVYRRQMGIEIENWIRGLSPEDVTLVNDWLILEVKADREAVAD